MEFKISSLNYDFRVKKMNAIEVLAIRTHLVNETIDDTINFFYEVLERIEVKFEDKWLPVKIKNVTQLTPTMLNEDIIALREIIDFFIKTYLRTVFSKSNESSN